MHYRADVIDNGVGQVWRLNYLCDIQDRTEQGNGLVETVCMDCVVWSMVQGVRVLDQID